MPNSLIVTALALWLACFGAAATGSGQVRGLPRVGPIRNDQPSTPRRQGCAAHPLALKEGAEQIIFDSHDDGQDAYMNLNGNNVKLRLVRTTLTHLDQFGTADAVYEYRYKSLRIKVSLQSLYDYTTWVPATVVLRHGRRARTIKAFVAPQCDAI